MTSPDLDLSRRASTPSPAGARSGSAAAELAVPGRAGARSALVARSRPRHDPYTPVGAIVRQYRRELGMTQADLSVQSGVSESAITKIESGNRVVTAELLARLAGPLELSDIQLARLTVLTERRLSELHRRGRTTPLSWPWLHRVTQLSAPAALFASGGVVVEVANPPFEALFPGVHAGRNFLEWLVLDPRAKTVLPEWKAEAHRAVRRARENMTSFIPDIEIATLTANLRDHPDFKRFWTSRVDLAEGGPRKIAVRTADADIKQWWVTELSSDAVDGRSEVSLTEVSRSPR
ncbi:helix-turn-helix domain-containing protein [Nocardia asteroides]|uniref:helix-turn-helix domain-containing protein n=1 Tax=Nocardia asteroides TaxID=1824 RepID=UPI0037C7895D